MRKVTENEKMVFEFIKDRIEEGYPPTVREICAEFGFKSTSTAHRYINNLTAKGLLEKGNNQNRAIRLTGGNGMKIPLVGTVTAGIPITAIEEITDYISFQPARHYSNPLFALKVRGESMINAAILDGDMVVIEQTPYAENGDIVVAMIEDSATVKRFYKKNDKIILHPENETMCDIVLDDVTILGVVEGLLRKF